MPVYAGGEFPKTNIGRQIQTTLIIARYLVKETVQALLAVTSVLLLIFLGRHFARFLADAAAGRIPGELVLQLLTTLTISSLVFLLPVSFYIAILVSFGRMYKDSEITAMAAGGIGTSKILRIMLTMSLVFGLLVALLSLYISPWSVEQGLKIRDFADSQYDLSMLVQGKFQTFGEDRNVFYVENLSKDKDKMQNVFVFTAKDAAVTVYYADSGYQYMDERTGDRFIVLLDGMRYEGVPGQNDFRVYKYQKSAVRVEPKEVRAQFRNVDAKPSDVLWRSADLKDLAEFHWRLAMPISAVIMSLLAVLLSRTSPRQGRYGKLLAGILVYIVYFNLMGIGKTWIKNGLIPAPVGLWWLHLLLGAVVIAMFVRQYGWRYLVVRQKQRI